MKLLRILSALADSAENYPENIAVITDEVEWTYHSLWNLVRKTNTALGAIALPIGSPIAVTAHKSVATLVLVLALGQREHTPLILSPDLGNSVKPAIFKSAGVYCELTATFEGQTSFDNLSINITLQREIALYTYSTKDAPLMLTTSGSTGIPKVVVLDANGINAFFDWASHFFALSRESRVLSYAPLNFDLSLLEVWAPLALGGTTILTNPNKATQSNYLQSLISEKEPHLIQGVPMFYSLLCEGTEAVVKSIFRTPHIIFTGDVMPLALRKRVASLFPTSIFHNVYGCTETNDSFVHTATPSDVIKYERLPIGAPIQGTMYRIIDDAGEILNSIGEGELHTSTPFLAKHYTESDQSDAAFYWDHTEKRRYYKTGDRVALDKNGELILLGRNDYIVKVRGVRTNLQDIEQILNLSEWVHTAVVIPIHDELAGVILHAVIEPKEDKKMDGLSLRTLCAQHLPLTSVPSRFHLYETTIPRTSTGKPDRKKVAQFIQKKEM